MAKVKETGRQRSGGGAGRSLTGKENYVPIRTGRKKGIPTQSAAPTKPYPFPIPVDFLIQHPRATEPEWAIYWAHGQLGLIEHLDFVYQDNIFAHSTSAASIDFIELDPLLAIEIQGEFAHYKLGTDKLIADMDRRQILESEGFPVIFIDEDDAERDPVFYLRDALNGVDHSKAGGV